MKIVNTENLLNYCLKRKKSLTPSRTLVIKTLAKYNKPVTAYKLRDENPFPFYISSNMPNSKAHNERLFAKYRSRNPHL